MCQLEASFHQAVADVDSDRPPGGLASDNCGGEETAKNSGMSPLGHAAMNESGRERPLFLRCDRAE